MPSSTLGTTNYCWNNHKMPFLILGTYTHHHIHDTLPIASGSTILNAVASANATPVKPKPAHTIGIHCRFT